MTSTGTNVKIYTETEIIAGGETTNLVTAAEGNLYLRNGKYYIIYEEPDVSQMKDCTTTVKTDLKTVSVKRGGSINTNLEFELNCEKRCVYKFEFGTIIMETKATVIEVSLTEEGGVIYLEYELDTGGEKSLNKLKMTITKK